LFWKPAGIGIPFVFLRASLRSRMKREHDKEIDVKILGLSCSPRKLGNTVTLLSQVLDGAKAEGAEVELYSVHGKNIGPCTACGGCSKTGECTINDDMQDLYAKLLESDGIVFGTPVYFYGMTAQAKAIIDRSFAMNKPEKSLANKVAGVVVTGGSMGLVDALKDLYFYMVTRQMVPANYVAAYPKADIRQMEKCMKAASDLGRQMALIAAQGFKYPSGIGRAGFAYGTHTL
jgi:multimeric flavodoxin WrbA